MSLKLMYITNKPEVATIAQNCGVDRIWIDMEYIGKTERQGGMNTVQNHHTIEDIKALRPLIKKSQLLVRINPIHKETSQYMGSEKEINATIDAGADIIMLPMFKNENDVLQFNKLVDKRVRKVLLLETAEALNNIDTILEIDDLDEIHIGLNDLHLALHKKFMFELLTDGTVEQLCDKFKKRGIPYGFGGIARIGYGDVPSEYIIAEHYRLGSSAAILSRSFCNANKLEDINEIGKLFSQGIKDIREKEEGIASYSEKDFYENKQLVKTIVEKIVEAKS